MAHSATPGIPTGPAVGQSPPRGPLAELGQDRPSSADAFSDGSGGPSRRRWLLALLAVVAALLFATMPRRIYVGDPVSIRVATIQWLRTGSTVVPPSAVPQFGRERGQYFYENPQNGELHSKYGIANIAVSAIPLSIERLTGSGLGFLWQLDAQAYSRRCLILNLFNIAIALALAAYLFSLCCHVAPPSAAAAYTMAVFFCTFVWNYLRAQTSEVYQALFLTAACYHVLRASLRPRALLASPAVRRHVLGAVAWTALLVLTKVSYVALLPFLGALLLLGRHDWTLHWPRAGDLLRLTRRHGRGWLICVALPWTGVLALLLLSNRLRFGSMLATGYDQWEPLGKIFTWDLREAVSGLLLEPRKSVLLHFPLLPFAALMTAACWRRRPFAALAGWLVLAVLVLSTSCLTIWRGNWSYGPRYLMPVLPVCSVPAAILFDRRSYSRPLLAPFLGVAVAASLWSAGCQITVNSLEFFAPFRAAALFVKVPDPRVAAYFQSTYWNIDDDLIALRDGSREFPPLEAVRDGLGEQSYASAREVLVRLADPNWFWASASARTAGERSQ
jgi:hypothetical protein